MLCPLSTPTLLPLPMRKKKVGFIGEAEKNSSFAIQRARKNSVFQAWIKVSLLSSLHLPLPRSGGCWAQGLAPTGSGRLPFALPGCTCVPGWLASIVQIQEKGSSEADTGLYFPPESLCLSLTESNLEGDGSQGVTSPSSSAMSCSISSCLVA